MNAVVTELVIDARTAKQGTAEYVAAMQAAQAAVDRTLDRERALQTAMNTGGAVMQTSATSVQRASRELDRLKASIDPAFHSARALERDIGTLDRAVTRLGLSEADAARMLEAVRLKHDAVAQAAKRQTEEYLKLAAAGRAAYAADMSQSQVNQQLGVVDVRPGAARASASVFEEDARATDQMAAAAQRLRAELDPVAAAQDRMNAELAEYQAMASRGVITSGELANAQARARQRFEETTTKVRAGGAGINSFSDALRNASTQASLFHGPLGGIASRMTALNSLLSSGGIAVGIFTLGLGASIYMIGSAVRAHEAYERSGRRLEAVTRATAGSVGMQAREVRDFTRDLALNTLASVEESEQAAAKLLTFRSVQQDTFKRTLEAAQDLAEAGFGTLESAAVQLGKALEDPEQGLSALTRVGVSFSAAQKQIIRDLMETGRIAEAQRVILEGVERQVGGTGRNAAQGLSGALDTLSQRWGENKVALEDWLGSSPALIAIVNRLAGELDRLNQSLSPDRFGKPTEDTFQLLEKMRAERERVTQSFLDRAGKGSVEELFPYERMALDPQIESLTARIRDLEVEISSELEKQFFLRQLNNRQARQAREDAERERGQESYEKRRRDLEATIDLARVDLDLVGKSVAETERRRMVETVLIEARQRGGQAAVDALSKEIEITRDGITLKTTELALLKERAAEFGRIRAQQAARDTISAQGDELEMMRLERDNLGQSAVARDRAIAALRTEQEIRRLGIDLYSDEARQMRENTAALSAYAEALARANLLNDLQFERDQIGRTPLDQRVADRLRGSGLEVDLSSYEAGLIRANQLLEQQRDTWKDIQDIGVGAIDSFRDGLLSGDFDGMFEGIRKEIGRMMLDLGVFNQMKNSVYGTQLPTLDTVGGVTGFFSALLGGKMPGAGPIAQSVASMAVQAAVVNINGGLGGDVARLLNPANSNLPGQVTRAPLADIAGTAGPAGTVSGSGVREQIWNFFAQKGLAPHQIAGIVGHAKAESAFNPLAVGDNGTSFGLFQHHKGRADALMNHIGGRGNLGDVQKQLEFTWKELQGPESAALKKLMASGNVREATRAWGQFERPQGFSAQNPEGMHNWTGRLAGAEKAMQDFATKSAEAAVKVADLGLNAVDATDGLGDLATSLVKGMGEGGGGGGGILKLLMGLFGFSSGTPNTGGMRGEPRGIVHGQEAVIPLPSGGRVPVQIMGDAGPRQQSAPAPVRVSYQTVVHNNAGVQVREETRDDGQGGVRQDIFIDEMVATAINRPGGQTGRTLRQRGLEPQRAVR